MDTIKIIFGVGILVILLIVIVFFSKQTTVTIHNHTYLVEIATTPSQQEKGLSGRNSLLTDHGMFFVFEKEGYYPFWMKDMKFSIDIIYIANGKVVTLFKNVKPATDPFTTIVKPTQPVTAVLEINAGEADKYTILVGDQVNLSQ